MNEDRYDSVEELIPKYLAGEASAEEEKRILAWLAQRPENEFHYRALKKVFELSQKHYSAVASPPTEIDVDKEWAYFVNQIKPTERPVVKLQSEHGMPRVWLRIAAALIVLVISGIVINYFVLKNNEVRFQTAENTQTVLLPDGSHVVLDRHSELSYSAKLGEKNRTVTLKGEAFFEVVHNTQKPFIIQIKETQIEVVGTSFNVQGYDTRKEVEVVVQTGVVSFSVPEKNEKVKLAAGQKGVYSKENHQLTSTINKDVNFLAWNTRKITFTESDLRTVVETLNKTYPVNITLAADIPASCVVTVSFDHQTLEAVLHVLETTLNLTYKVNGNQIEITHAGC